MAELLKNRYNDRSIRELALRMKAVYQPFRVDDFVDGIMDETWDGLALKARMRRITVNLGKHLPNDYEQALGIIDKVVAGYPAGFNDFTLMYLSLIHISSDASSTTCFDVRARGWSEEFICRTGLDRDFFPDCHESTEIAGEVSPECERQTGLRAGIPVIFGGGDQQCQCIGNGAYQEGVVVSNIGTGGEIDVYKRQQLEIRLTSFDKDPAYYGAAALAINRAFSMPLLFSDSKNA